MFLLLHWLVLRVVLLELEHRQQEGFLHIIVSTQTLKSARLCRLGQCQNNTSSDNTTDGVLNYFRYSVRNCVWNDVSDFGTVSENVKDNIRGNVTDNTMDSVEISF